MRGRARTSTRGDAGTKAVAFIAEASLGLVYTWYPQVGYELLGTSVEVSAEIYTEPRSKKRQGFRGLSVDGGLVS